MKNKLFTITQVAKRLNVGKSTVRNYCFQCIACNKPLKKCTCGKKQSVLHPLNLAVNNKKSAIWRISEESLNQFLKDRRY